MQSDDEEDNPFESPWFEDFWSDPSAPSTPQPQKCSFAIDPLQHQQPASEPTRKRARAQSVTNHAGDVATASRQLVFSSTTKAQPDVTSQVLYLHSYSSRGPNNGEDKENIKPSENNVVVLPRQEERAEPSPPKRQRKKKVIKEVKEDDEENEEPEGKNKDEISKDATKWPIETEPRASSLVSLFYQASKSKVSYTFNLPVDWEVVLFNLLVYRTDKGDIVKLHAIKPEEERTGPGEKAWHIWRRGTSFGISFKQMSPSSMKIFKVCFFFQATTTTPRPASPSLKAESLPGIIYSHTTAQRNKAIHSLLSHVYPDPSQLTNEDKNGCFSLLVGSCYQPKAFATFPSFTKPAPLWNWVVLCSGIIEDCSPLFVNGYMHGYVSRERAEVLLHGFGIVGLFFIRLGSEGLVGSVLVSENGANVLRHVKVEPSNMDGIRKLLASPVLSEVLCGDNTRHPKKEILARFPASKKKAPHQSNKEGGYVTLADMKKQYN